MPGMCPDASKKPESLDWLSDMQDSFDALVPSETPAAPAAVKAMQSAAAPVADGFSVAQSVKKLDLDALAPTYNPGGASELLELSQSDLARYAETMLRALNAAQLSSSFVNPAGVRDWLAALSTLSLTGDHFALQPETGMPSTGLWNQLHGARALGATPGAFRTVLGQAVQRFTELPDLKLEETEVKVVSRAGANTRTFEVATNRRGRYGHLVRTAFEIHQANTPNSAVKLEGGAWKPSAELQKILDVSHVSSLSTLAIAAQKLCGESFVSAKQGVTGPVWFDGVEMPSAIQDIIDASPTKATIATFTEFEMRPNGSFPSTWFDPSDVNLLHAYENGWSASAKKTWSCSSAIAEPLAAYAAANDHTLVIQSFS